MSRRTPILAANWKMNLRRDDAVAYCRKLCDGQLPDNVEVVVFPPFPLLATLAAGLQSTAVAWGGQDVHPEASGAHTGDTAAANLLDFDASWALCGHSERRADHDESDAWVGRKVAAARSAGLAPMLCVGESEAEREAGTTSVVLSRQLAAGISGLTDPEGGWALAYEPVWAIGTGRSATPALAQEAHAHLRAQVAAHLGSDIAGALRIVYGGSVKPANCEELLRETDIDGFLVGGAGLDPGSFLDIIRRCGTQEGAAGDPSA
ncbi:MAG: triose-phosphate isomerase [Acidobacteriota bacterium]|nr:triose-phosphate isomerase [Acidobacteriota bacterium]